MHDQPCFANAAQRRGQIDVLQPRRLAHRTLARSTRGPTKCPRMKRANVEFASRCGRAPST
eukprot:3085417-Lingulodinium_polyedra.AAC.1